MMLRAIRYGFPVSGESTFFPVEAQNNVVPMPRHLFTMISTRLFLERPSSLSLLAIGLASPHPFGSTIDSSIPIEMISLATISDRLNDSVSLIMGVPVLSV
jgi:hypothetical protein